MNDDQRLTNFQKMAEADPDNELAHYSLGKIYFERGAYAEAITSLKRTLDLSPKHSLAHRFLGEALLAQGEEAAGIEILKAGILLAHDKGEFMPRNQMQEVLQKRGVELPELPATTAETSQTPSQSEAQGDDGFTCRRCGRSGQALAEAPFTNDLGRQIVETICQECWREWMGMSVKVINECRLNLMSPKDSEVYDQHMREFLGLP